MFDQNINESKVVAVTRVVERTISPDKVTDMYREVRKEVESNIIDRFTLRSNDFSCSVIVWKEPMTDRKRFVAKYVLNGKEQNIADYVVSTHEEMLSDKQVMIEKILDHYKDQLTRIMANDVISIIDAI